MLVALAAGSISEQSPFPRKRRPLILVPMPPLSSLIADGRRLEAEHAIWIVIESCKAFAREPEHQGVLLPSRLVVSDTGVTIGPYDMTATDFGYTAPEIFNSVRGSRLLAGGRDSIGSWGIHVPKPGYVIDHDAAAVFALGCILWELLAGRPLFRGFTDYATLELAAAAEVPVLSAPPELEAIVRTALARDVHDRYRSPRQLADALADYLTACTTN